MDCHISVLKDPARIPEIIKIFQTGLGETTLEHWEWRLFTDNGLQPPEAIIAENEAGQIVGVSSVLSQEYGNKDYRCAQLCDWVIHPDLRGQGLLGKLYRFTYARYENMGADFISTYPNHMSYPIFQKYQFDEIDHIGSWETTKHILFHRVFPEDCEKDGLRFCFTDTCPLSSFTQHSGRIYRTPRFMHWKFDLNPDTKFRWLTVWDKDHALGYFVYTLTKGRIHTAVNVYDWDFDPHAPEAFNQCIHMLDRLGNWVSVWGYYGEENHLLHRSSMQKIPGNTRLMLKAMSAKGFPENLFLTRCDTDF